MLGVLGPLGPKAWVSLIGDPAASADPAAVVVVGHVLLPVVALLVAPGKAG